MDTTSSIFEALKLLIPNIPNEVISLDLSLSANKAPKITIGMYVYDANNDINIIDGSPETKTVKFKIVEDDK